jgi:hypothetical protein
MDVMPECVVFGAVFAGLPRINERSVENPQNYRSPEEQKVDHLRLPIASNMPIRLVGINATFEPNCSTLLPCTQ